MEIKSNIATFVQLQDDPRWRARTIVNSAGKGDSIERVLESLRNYKENPNLFQRFLDAVETYSPDTYERIPHGIDELMGYIKKSDEESVEEKIERTQAKLGLRKEIRALTESERAKLLNELAGEGGVVDDLRKIHRLEYEGMIPHRYITGGAILVLSEDRRDPSVSLHDPGLSIACNDDDSAKRLFDELKEACLKGGSTGLNYHIKPHDGRLMSGAEERVYLDDGKRTCLSECLRIDYRKGAEPIFTDFLNEKQIKQLEEVGFKDKPIGVFVQSIAGFGWDDLGPVIKYLRERNVSFVLSTGKCFQGAVAYHVVQEE